MTALFQSVWTEFRDVIVILAILLVTFTIAKLISRMFDRFFSNVQSIGKLDKTSLYFIRRLVVTAIYILGVSAALVQIPEFKVVGHSLLAGAGILTVVGGLASQQILTNLLSGVLIVLFKPFKLGDKITVGTQFTGVVEDITLRETVLRDAENNRVIVPNAMMSSQILINANHTDNRICKFIEIGVGYSADIEQAMAIMAEEVMKHPLHIDNRNDEQKQNNDPVVAVRVMSLGASSVNLRAWAWANTGAEGFVMQCDLLKSIKQRFDQAGIEIPFPQTTVSFAKNDSLSVTTQSSN